MREFWERLSGRRRVGLLVGVAVIVLAVFTLGVLLLMPARDVLFSALAPQDAAAITAELEKMKVPYQVSEDGQSILVDKGNVHKLRMKLMARDIPLHGAVGFELFNNNDFGMTEFAQKVNYQRALQGEITRTILSLEEIDSARVHLVFAEEGLLKRNPQRAKASITVGVRHGRVLKPDQVFGVQRLVAAAVPGIAVGDVTVLSQRGVVLSRSSDEAGDDGARLGGELQQDVERQLNRKVIDVLTKAYGAEQFVSSVSVTLDMNQVRVTSEEVLGANAGADMPQGLVLRERETLTETPTPGGNREAIQVHGRTSRDTEYQLGRRVEQIVKRPGAVVRIQVLAVVRQRLDASQLERLRSVLSAAVGAQGERGDVITVQSLDMLGGAGDVGAGAPAKLLPSSGGDAGLRPGIKPAADHSAQLQPLWQGPPNLLILVLLGLVVLTGAVLVGRLSTGRIGGRRLSMSERELVLSQLRQWTMDGLPKRGDASARPADGAMQ